MKIKGQFQYHNRYDLTLLDAKSGKVKQKVTAYNLMTNAFYNRLKSGEDRVLDFILLGTGTGVPAPTDTDLFQTISRESIETRSDIRKEGPNQYSRVYTRTFNESQANGVLTEVGIGDYYTLWSHAMFTDSEGNPITIEKTSTDRLTVAFTIFLTVSVDNALDYRDAFVDARLCVSMACMRNQPEPQSLSWDDTPVLLKIGFSDSFPVHFGMNLCDNACLRNHYFRGLDGQRSYVSDTGVIRWSYGRVLSSDWNESFTYQIRALDAAVGKIQLPNSDVFPPITLELEQIASANQTDFDFGIAELSPEVRVFVNGTVQPANSYVWGGKDFNIRQAWASQHGTYLVETTEPSYNPSFNAYNGEGTPLPDVELIQHWSFGPEGTIRKFVYDFQTPKTVNTFRSAVQYYSHVWLYYSSDGENWNIAHETTSSTNYIDATFTAITARYWKIELDKSVPYNQYWNTLYLAFDYVQPQLKFNSPLSEGDIVKVEAKSEFPIKNSNWIIDQTLVDFKITGGNS